MDQKVIDEVTKVLQSGWITTGPVTREFELALTEYVDSKQILCVSSATSGLELILRWFGVGEGDEVILPAYTYSATANVILHVGAKPVFVDITDDFVISVEHIAKAITQKTKVIIPVDIGGYPADYDEIFACINDPAYNQMFVAQNEVQDALGRILILSDSAHSLGAKYKQQKAGSIADISVFSFHAVKNLTTGEGGAIAFNLPEPFNNESIYNYLKIIALHGQTKDSFTKMLNNGWEYDILYPGYKANMPDILAAIGLVELRRYDSETLPKRKSIFNYYSEQLKQYEWAIIPNYENQNKRSSYHLYMLRMGDTDLEKRDSIIRKMYNKGVAVNIHYKPLPMMSYYKKLGYDMAHYPNTYKHYKNEISLPVYYDLTFQEMSTVINTLANIYKNHDKNI